jgi:alanyl-tRNA synthetase
VTERLYYTDPYLRRFEAQVEGSAANRVYLDRTAFYPSSGGQPNDLGTIGGLAVTDVIDEEDRIAHIVAGDLPSGRVECEIDWPRRLDHMQQHSGQHLLSAVLVELYGIGTVSFHLGSDASTIDVEAPSLDAEQLSRAVERANAIVFENRPVSVSFASNSDDLGLRKASEREGELRIVSIENCDRSACGGTHVRSTAEIGPVAVRGLDKIRGNVRIEFLCGWRAIRRARADYESLLKVSRLFSAALDDTPDVVAAQARRLQDLEKAYRKLSAEAAAREGRDLYASCARGADGIRRVIRTARIDEELRTLALSFTAGERAVFIAISSDPPSVLVAASKDAGIHAGNLVKAAVTAHGGRGGGSPTLGQGSVPNAGALEQVRAAITPSAAGSQPAAGS